MRLDGEFIRKKTKIRFPEPLNGTHTNGHGIVKGFTLNPNKDKVTFLTSRGKEKVEGAQIDKDETCIRYRIERY